MGRTDHLRLAMVAVACLATVAPGAWAGRKPDPAPFQVDADSLSKRYRRMAVSCVNTIGGLHVVVPDDSTTRFASGLATKLAGAGWSIVPADSVLSLWHGVALQEGGIFDPRTGRRDSTRVRRVTARTSQTLRDSLQADLWLHYGLVVVSADYDDGMAEWDGVKCNVGAQGFIATLLTGFQSGTIPALSLEVEIHDLDGRLLYARRGGLVSVNHMIKDRWVPVPTDTLRSSAVREPALTRALTPWLDRVRPVTISE